MKNCEKLRSRQMLAIQHIIASATHEEACRKAKISKGTLYAWLKDVTFKAELKRQRDEVVHESLDRLKCALSKAVDGLIGLMGSSLPDFKKHFVYKDIIDYSLKSVEIENIEERLAKIEEAIAKKGEQGS